MSKKSSFRAVVFDLDGTLLDTLQDLEDSMNRILAAHGHPLHPDSAYKRFVGNGARKLIERAVPEEFRTSDVVEQYLEEFLEDYSRNWAVKTAPYQGIPELLDELERRGVPMAVLSNKIHRFTEMCVEKFLDARKFQYVFGERDGIPRKPDPAGALEIAQKMEIAPEHMVYVGDTPTDMQTGRSAGMFTVGVLWGFRPEEELREHGAMKLIAKPSELLELF